VREKEEEKGAPERKGGSYKRSETMKCWFRDSNSRQLRNGLISYFIMGMLLRRREGKKNEFLGKKKNPFGNV